VLALVCKCLHGGHQMSTKFKDPPGSNEEPTVSSMLGKSHFHSSHIKGSIGKLVAIMQEILLAVFCRKRVVTLKVGIEFHFSSEDG